MNHARFRIIETSDAPHGAALFRGDDFAVVLAANRALRRHPEALLAAFEAVEEDLFEIYGWRPVGRHPIRWVGISKANQTVTFYTNDTERGLVERTPEGYAESLDWTRPIEPSAHWMPRARPLSSDWELLGLALLEMTAEA